jgi:serine O-acetyltransferase
MQFKYLRHDLYRYFYPNDNISKLSLPDKLMIVLRTQGIWAIVVYRLMRWVQYECPLVLIKLVFRPIGFFLQLFIEITTGIYIAPEADIGPGFYIGHFGNIFIGCAVTIGKFVNISQEVTIGHAGRGDNWGYPHKIGDFVYIAPGAKIVGKITIGNNVVVGTNSVVTKSLPDNAVAFGVPARIISYSSSRDFIRYNHVKNKEILLP